MGEGGAVQARLVAKLIADGRRVRAGRLRQFACGRLGVALLGKQADGAMQQPLARLLAVRAGLAPVVGGHGMGNVFFNHAGDLIIYLKRLI